MNDLPVHYRYNDGSFNDTEGLGDVWVRSWPPSVMEYKAVKETPCGYWLYLGWSMNDRWVSKKSRRRYAYPTKKEALESYIIRKEHQIAHCESTIRAAKWFLEEALKLKEKIK